jgi:single-strand DNA-binding protein
MKSITIAGNIGKDAVTRTTPNGEKVTGWSVAVEERNGQDRRSIWFDCTIWGKRGESLAQYLTKGGKVAVSGELSTRDHEGKTYLTIRVEQVTLLGGKPDGERQERGQQSSGYGAGGSANSGRSNMDDDIPFAPEFR